MAITQLAVISDIHGNRWALEAVLQDVRRRGVEHMVNLGDSFYGPLDPVGTAELLLPLGLPTVRGNEDRIVIEPANDTADSSTLRFVRDVLRPEHIRWLHGLAPTAVAYEDFFLCHGSPDRDDEYLLQEVSAEGVRARPHEELNSRLAAIRHPVVLCGHDHTPRTVNLPDGRLIVNPGSVGLPAYTDDLPFAHALEAGTPHARYSIVFGDKGRWRVENVAVPYDWQAAADAAQAHGRPDWAEWLRTGRAGVT